MKGLRVAAAVFLMTALSPWVALAGEGTPAEEDAGPAIPWEKKVETAVKRGLDYLAKTQEEDGAWSNAIGFKLNYNYRKTGEGPHVGVTAIAGLAFLAGGHTTGKGEYAANLKKALAFVLSCVEGETGFITCTGEREQGRAPDFPGGAKNKTGMYSHAFAGLFLAEVQAVAPRDDVKAKIQKAVNLLVKCQNEEGGWRYLPDAKDADISITACQLKFLKAAKKSGIPVPQTTIDQAMEYVKKCRITEGGQWASAGPFRYQASRPARSTFALTAAGLSALGATKPEKAPLTIKGLEYLLGNRLSRTNPCRNDFHYFYGHFHAVQVFHAAGGEWWKKWWEPARKEIIQAQREDGSWIDEVGPNYATAMACTILSAPKKNLSMFHK